jgi:hypothetical protein
MHFANPGFLWALLVLIIPIIIHLFKFRRYKQVFFPNIRFLKKIDEEQKSRKRLKDLLILLSRLLALSFLVFAFAMPFFGTNKSSSKGNVVSIYVDNSFSMENESEQGKLIDIAKKKAEELVMTFQASDQFQLITNDLEARHQRLVNRQAFLQFLYEVDLSASSVDLEEIYQRQKALLEEEAQYDRWIAFISDMQQSTSDLENINVDENYHLLFIPIAAINYNNIYIDSLWFEDPVRQLGKGENLNFRIKNDSDEDLDEVQIKLTINGQMKSMASISLEAGTKKDTLLHFSNDNLPGIQNAILSVNDKPIEFDNDFYFSYELKEKIKVSELYSAKAQNYFRLIYSDSLFEYSPFPADQIDYQQIGEADLLILNDLNDIPSGLNSYIADWLQNGGHIYISPGTDFSENDYNALLKDYGASISSYIDSNDRRVSYLALDNKIFKGVLKSAPQGKALPQSYDHYVINLKDLSWEVLFQLQGGDPFLVSRKVGDGRIYLQALPTVEDWSNWPRHALFITTMLRIAEESQRVEVLDHRIGDWSVIEIQSSNNALDRPNELRAKDGNVAFIPSQQWIDRKLALAIKDEIKKAGFYDLMNGDELIHTLAFNYSRKESDLRFISNEELEKWRDGRDEIKLINRMDRPLKKSEIRDERPLWKYFIIAALIFLLIEIMIIKWLKQG